MINARKVKNTLLPVHWSVASRLPLLLRRHYLHTVGTQRLGNFSSPHTFNEKINWRILHDRRTRIVYACDKLRMKEVASRFAIDDKLRIPRTLWSGTNLREVPDKLLDEPWVLKPNHSSGKVIFGPRSLEQLEWETRDWLDTDPATLLGEWGYGNARHTLLIEERIPGPDIPRDYKIYVFNGKPKMIQVNSGRFSTPHTESYFDPEWRHLPLHDGSLVTRMEPCPQHLTEMLRYAELLSAGWDFIRIDFYDAGGSVWFGEYTPYPGGGVARWCPRGWDHRLGSWWVLPDLDETDSASDVEAGE